jgi:CxxC motif-containing protein (DUF1111 family)
MRKVSERPAPTSPPRSPPEYRSEDLLGSSAHRYRNRNRSTGTFLLVVIGSSAGCAGNVPDDMPSAVLQTYADIVLATYEDSVAGARALDRAIDALLAEPGERTLNAARERWKEARASYGYSEAFRFYNGPIDRDGGPEGRLNAWPLDENHIDAVDIDRYAAAPGLDIVGDAASFPNISPELIAAQNEAGGEKNVASGYHAIEFLLWGQDFNEPPETPGNRPYTDYVPQTAASDDIARRRGRYLKAAITLLIRDLESVAAQWRPVTPAMSNYRAEFIGGAANLSVGRMLTGLITLAEAEIAGERISVPLLSGDQEEEQSCFSDTTADDLRTNAAGIEHVYFGRYTRLDGSAIAGPSLADWLQAVDPSLAEQVEQRIAETRAALAAIRDPFDREIQPDNAAGRARARAAVEALQTEARVLAGAASALGIALLESEDLADVVPLLEPASGGAATVRFSGRSAFAQPAANLDTARRAEFFVGNAFFNSAWVVAPATAAARDGLGPLFNARSCDACHNNDGRGQPPLEPGERPVALVIQLSGPTSGENNEPLADPVYGANLNPYAIGGVPAEGSIRIEPREIQGEFADGEGYTLVAPEYRFEALAYGELGPETRFSPRVAPPVFGLGLLQAVPEEQLLAWSDPDDADGNGISGRPNRVWDYAAARTVVGRFGWKANQPDIAAQTAAAFSSEIGLSTSLRPLPSCTKAQTVCREALDGGVPEVSDALFEQIVAYQRRLAVPARRGLDAPEVREGARRFLDAGCTACHRPTLTTAVVEDEPWLSEQTIHPYTDLLLHDMGPGLADDRPDFEANGSEWRTPPLWGLGLQETVNGHTRLLHDGRARDVREAILWHGGEAEGAKQAFLEMSKHDREALLAFLASL